MIEGVKRSKYLTLHGAAGALYAFIGVRDEELPASPIQQFALELLEEKHVLVTPGSAFNVPYRNHFRITLLPDAATITTVFERIEAQLDSWSARHAQPAPVNSPRLVEAAGRFK